MIKVQLRRAFTPEEVGVEVSCGICGCWFTTGTVLACVLEPFADGESAVYSWCLAHLNYCNPKRFPGMEELLEANERYPEPVYASAEEVTRLEQADDPLVRASLTRSAGLSERSLGFPTEPGVLRGVPARFSSRYATWHMRHLHDGV